MEKVEENREAKVSWDAGESSSSMSMSAVLRECDGRSTTVGLGL